MNKLQPQNLFKNPVQPRNVALTVVGKNISAMSRHMPLNTDPFIYGIAVNNNSQTLKDLKNTNYFSFNFMSWEDISDTDFCGRVSGADTLKLEKTDLALEDYKEKTDYITSSMGVLILKKKELVDFGDHHLVVGEVIEMLGNGQEPKDLDPVVFWGRGFYSHVGETKRYRSPKLAPKN